MTKVFVNGSIDYLCNNVRELYSYLVSQKRKGLINIYTSISFNSDLNEINVYTDGGRCCRPLYIMDNGGLRISREELQRVQNRSYGWFNLMIGSLNKTDFAESEDVEKPNTISEGVIEYIDTEESEYKYIAMNINDVKKKDKGFSHCEIHPCLI